MMEFEDARENEAVAQKALEANTDCNTMIGYGGAACDALDNWNKATQWVLIIFYSNNKFRLNIKTFHRTNLGE